MKKPQFILLTLTILLILIILVFFNMSTAKYQFSEQVRMLDSIVQCDYSKMGDSYDDEIYEKYDLFSSSQILQI